MAQGGLVTEDGRECYRIDGLEDMAPFLATVVSDTDLWMFVASTGALTAGRVDADHALFPYETDDRLYRAAEITGPVTVVARTHDGDRELWRPFGREVTPGCTRSISKGVLGDHLTFEERHAGWGMALRVTWAPADEHGWVRTVALLDVGGGGGTFEVLDGLLDVMPAGVDALTEQIRSNLVDAYKRSEVGPWGTLAVYSLEAQISDRAEPVEALTATTVWSAGFDEAAVDLDHRAVGDMLAGRDRSPSHLVTGRPGAYLLRGPVTVPADGAATWMLVADTDRGHAEVVEATHVAAAPDAAARVRSDIAAGSERLRRLLRGADAEQSTGDAMADAHHLSNVLFNSMRGGVFPYGHAVPVGDLATFVRARNRPVHERWRAWFDDLGDVVDVTQLRAAAADTGDPDLLRLVLEYLPLTFSRRHGDPSRPWNRFSINVRDDDGEQVLAYEGNWRDIFQNWEALLHSYPAYLPNVVAKFLNASTIEGYNPYRISQDGIDWEVPDPDDPWSHIGYWGDHQVVYLLRLLETWEQFEPGGIAAWLDRPIFTYADVPYTLAGHDEMVRDPRSTITFDEERAAEIARRDDAIGADGRLVVGPDGALLRVGMLEKLLVTALAKLTNYVPEGGIWLNTQRPEWNDANNALAGPGLSMVTLYQLHRYLGFLRTRLAQASASSVEVQESVARWCRDITAVFADLADADEAMDDVRRRAVLDALGRSGQAHRDRMAAGEGHAPTSLSLAEVRRLCDVATASLDRTIAAGRRDDGLVHSYNRVSFPSADTAQVDHLTQMLEGQVAVVASGALDARGVLDLVAALYDSPMYRPDQDTFMLYPATQLPPFLERNVLSDEAAARIEALGDGESLAGPVGKAVARDVDGRLHFRADAVNAKALVAILDRAGMPPADREVVLDVYEEVFDHASFTGRSGSMYGYEGLGSIYWHMVAKLLLAVQDAFWAAVDAGEDDDLVAEVAAAYRRIRAGLGFMKDPETFGAFPTDCYSHTPAHAGAQQPGMTGQVKEEVLTRFAELGLRVVDGRAMLQPGLLAPDDVVPGQFTVAGVDVAITTGEDDAVTLVRADGTRAHETGLVLGRAESDDLFARRGAVERVEWTIGEATMQRWRRAT